MTAKYGPNTGLLESMAQGGQWTSDMHVALRGHDFLLQPVVKSLSLTIPPVTPSDGDAYVVATGGSGAWSGHDTNIARWTTTTNAWEFLVPKSGWIITYAGSEYMFNGTAWAPYSSGGGGGDVSGPSSAVSSNFSSFDGTTGKLIKDSGYGPTSFQPAGSYEAALGNPGTSGYILSSTTGGVRSWIAPTAYTLPVATSSVLGGVKPDGTSILNSSGSISVTLASVGAEGALGNPGTNGYLLSSTTSGTRSWVAPYSLPVATSSVLGGVKPDGTSILNSSGAISATATSVGAEPALGNPSTNGYVLSSTTSGTRSWVAASGYTLPIATNSTLGGVKPDGTSILNSSGAISVTPASVGAEPALGNPSVSGYVLSSSAAGVRSWIATSGGGGTVTQVNTQYSTTGGPFTTTGTVSLVNDVATPPPATAYCYNGTARGWYPVTADAGSAGTAPSYTDNGNGSVTIGSADYVLFSSSTGAGLPQRYTIAGGTFTLTDQSQNYIIADYNSGTPNIHVTTDVTTIDNITTAPLFTIFRDGTTLHTTQWGAGANALANRLSLASVKTGGRFKWQEGLTLGEVATRIVSITTGVIWLGPQSISLGSFNSNTNTMYFLYHSSGTWTKTTTTQYNNSQYDDGSNLQSLGTNKYGVCFIYRGVESDLSAYMVLGNAAYGSLAAAQAAQPPSSVPPLISSHCVLVGRIIVLNGATSATEIDSAFVTSFAASVATNHNNLDGLQGGTTSQYYHLTSAQYTVATQYATTSQGGLLSSTDWTTFNNKASASQTFYLGTTQIAINRASAAIALTGITSIDGNAATATTATNATNTAITDDTSTNATMYPTWVTANTGNLPQKTTSTKLTFNPSTGALAATSFNSITGLASSSPAMDGTAAVGTSTLCARQDHVHASDTSRAAVGQTFYLGTTSIAINRSSSAIALTGITSIDGTAANATNTAITADSSTNATMYLTWVTTTTGNLPQKVSSSLTFNPSTGALSATSVNGITGLSSATPAAGSSAGTVGTATTVSRGDHAHPLPKVTLTYAWCWETAVTTSDWQPAYIIRAASTLKAIRAFQDSGSSSFTASTITIYKNGSSWKTCNLPASWTSGTVTDISTGLSDALADGDYLTAVVTTAGTHSKTTLMLEVEQAAH